MGYGTRKLGRCRLFIATSSRFICKKGAGTGIVNQKTQDTETLLGLAVMVIILSTGHISGAHLNPAVTIAFAALTHFPWKQVPMYIGAQVMASICAAFALKGIFHPYMSGGVIVPSVGYGQAFALEFICSFILMFVITVVATDTRAEGRTTSATLKQNLAGVQCIKPQHCLENLQIGMPLLVSLSSNSIISFEEDNNIGNDDACLMARLASKAKLHMDGVFLLRGLDSRLS